MKHSIRKTAALLTGVIFTVNTMLAANNSQIFNFSAFAEETEYKTYTDNESNVFS